MNDITAANWDEAHKAGRLALHHAGITITYNLKYLLCCI